VQQLPVAVLGTGVANSACPANSGVIVNGVIQIGQHHIGSATNYGMYHGLTSSDYQADWRWCNLCQGIFWGSDQSDSWCTGQLRAGGGPHEFGSGTSYDMFYT
jgi:hypothetical protein